MAGTINLALTQQFDMDGNPLSGGLLFFFVAATTTPQNAFQDIALTIPHPNPIVLDASGRVPMFYLADGNIKIRLADKAGVTVIAADNLLVIGPSSGGGGGGGSIDPTTVMATGDIKARFAASTATLTGFVRCNGLTIGNAVSGATERQNADCQALFEYLWATTVLGVFSGTTPNRGATANGDWIANKRIALPDLRGRTIAGLDDMGSTAAGRLQTLYFGVPATVLGNGGGVDNYALTSSEITAHSHALLMTASGGAVNVSAQTADHVHGIPAMTTGGASARHQHGFTAILGAANIAIAGSNTVGSATASAGTTGDDSPDHAHTIPAGTYNTLIQNADHAHNISGSTQPAGASAAHKNVQPTMVMTFYIKL